MFGLCLLGTLAAISGLTAGGLDPSTVAKCFHGWMRLVCLGPLYSVCGLTVFLRRIYTVRTECSEICQLEKWWANFISTQTVNNPDIGLNGLR